MRLLPPHLPVLLVAWWRAHIMWLVLLPWALWQLCRMPQEHRSQLWRIKYLGGLVCAAAAPPHRHTHMHTHTDSTYVRT